MSFLSSSGLPYLLWEEGFCNIIRYEKKYGRDESDSQPRCLYAAKFISAMNPTRETPSKHWIAAGQLQDLHTTGIFLDQFQYVDFALLVASVCDV